MNIKMYEVIEVTNPLHEKSGLRGIISGMLSVDGEIVSYTVDFAESEELVDPEDVEPTGKGISKAEYENGTWSRELLTKDQT
jgi:hypothetical protein